MYILTLLDYLHFLVSGSVSPLSTNEFSLPGESWESEIAELGEMCESLNTEFRKKFHVSYQSLNWDFYPIV